jgi:hypothetical protein
MKVNGLRMFTTKAQRLVLSVANGTQRTTTKNGKVVILHPASCIPHLASLAFTGEGNSLDFLVGEGVG